MRELLSCKCLYAVDAIQSGNLAFLTLITTAARWELLSINLDTQNKSTFELKSAKDRVTLIPVIKNKYLNEFDRNMDSSDMGHRNPTASAFSFRIRGPCLP